MMSHRIAAIGAAFVLITGTACGGAAAEKPRQFVGSPAASTSASPSPSATASPAVPGVGLAANSATTKPPAPGRTTAKPPAPVRTTAKPPAPPKTVTAGAFCSPIGAHGVTKTGKAMVCSSPDGKQARWRAA